MMKGLTARQRRFVDEYAASKRGRQAAIAAGYSKLSAASIASRLLKQPEIAAALSRRSKPPQPATTAPDVSLDPLALLLRVMRDPEERLARRIQAASLALPYTHAKLVPQVPGKKKQAAQAAKKASTSGRFGAAQPPARLHVINSPQSTITRPFGALEGKYDG